MKENKQIKIGIVDDHNLFRKGLIKLINLGDADNKYTILFEAENGNDLKEKINRKSIPDIILMDIDMPGMDGYETVEWLRKYHPDISVLVVSMFESEKPIMRMLKLGIKGYLSKDIEVEDMHKALEAIANKGFYYSDLVAGIMADNIQQGQMVDGINTNKSNDLSENEREFIKLVCQDMTYQEIATKMTLSLKTIDGYRDVLFKKWQVKSKTGLAIYAIRNGIVKLT